jgi:hypothetical protein
MHGQQYTGRYGSVTFPFYKGRYVIGNTLTLKKDATFFYQTCGENIRGKWKTKRDSLYLFCTSFVYRNDSLNNALNPLCNESEVYEGFRILKNGDLISEFRHKGKLYKNQLRKRS